MNKQKHDIYETKEKKSFAAIFLISTLLLLAINLFTVYLYNNTQKELIKSKEVLAVQEDRIATLQTSAEELNSLSEENDILNQRITDLSEEMVNLYSELEQEKAKTTPEQSSEVTKQIDPDYFTIGSTMEHVKEVMGTPKSISFSRWRYGRYSYVSFDRDGLVDGWDDNENILKVK